jgi:poly-gamma-glutamate capsule biosynthesis protein CapA/YwtB (metallophosphatase superfamily)
MAIGSITLFLCGDVMLGRGVDQILPHPGDPALRERYLRDARDYIGLADR